MASYASSLLDELMGRHRNANPDDKPKEARWSDPEVILGVIAWVGHTKECPQCEQCDQPVILSASCCRQL